MGMGYRTPKNFAKTCCAKSYGRDADCGHLEDTSSVSDFAAAQAAAGSRFHFIPCAEFGSRSTKEVFNVSVWQCDL